MRNEERWTMVVVDGRAHAGRRVCLHWKPPSARAAQTSTFDTGNVSITTRTVSMAQWLYDVVLQRSRLVAVSHRSLSILAIPAPVSNGRSPGRSQPYRDFAVSKGGRGPVSKADTFETEASIERSAREEGSDLPPKLTARIRLSTSADRTPQLYHALTASSSHFFTHLSSPVLISYCILLILTRC